MRCSPFITVTHIFDIDCQRHLKFPNTNELAAKRCRPDVSHPDVLIRLGGMAIDV